jgi:hypothetical protein
VYTLGAKDACRTLEYTRSPVVQTLGASADLQLLPQLRYCLFSSGLSGQGRLMLVLCLCGSHLLSYEVTSWGDHLAYF